MIPTMQLISNRVSVVDIGMALLPGGQKTMYTPSTFQGKEGRPPTVTR